jgi:hypothetical protein
MVVAGWLAELVPLLGVAAPGLWAAGPLVAESAEAIAPAPLPMRRPPESTQTPAANRKCVVEMMISSVLKRPRR